MSKRQFIMIFGAIVAALPFLGFPSLWDTALYVIVGLFIIVMAYRLDHAKPNMAAKQSSDLPYAEHDPGVSFSTASPSPLVGHEAIELPPISDADIPPAEGAPEPENPPR
jgi:hypothetical protein